MFSRQEGVGIGFYSPLDVTINTDEGEVLCRTYQMNNFTVHKTSPPYKQVRYMSLSFAIKQPNHTQIMIVLIASLKDASIGHIQMHEQ